MKVNYDAGVDVLRILLSDKTVFESDEEIFMAGRHPRL